MTALRRSPLRYLFRENGQTMTEYVILGSGIAVVCAAVVLIFGGPIEDFFLAAVGLF